MDLFIEKAYAQGSIPEKVFSLTIGPGRMPSSITFGGYDLETFATGDIKWHPTIQDYHWEVALSGFRVGDIRVPITMNKTLVDSGTSYISMPQSEFNALYQELKANLTCFKSGLGGTEVIFCLCPDPTFADFPVLTVELGTASYHIPPQSYLTRIGKQC